jgi:hypothetical protein
MGSLVAGYGFSVSVRPLDFGESRGSGGYFRGTFFQSRHIQEGRRSCHNRDFHKPRSPSMEPRYQRYPLRVWVGHAGTPFPLDGSLDELPSPFVLRFASSPPLDSHPGKPPQRVGFRPGVSALRTREVLYILGAFSRSTTTVVETQSIYPSLHSPLHSEIGRWSC